MSSMRAQLNYGLSLKSIFPNKGNDDLDMLYRDLHNQLMKSDEFIVTNLTFGSVMDGGFDLILCIKNDLEVLNFNSSFVKSIDMDVEMSKVKELEVQFKKEVDQLFKLIKVDLPKDVKFSWLLSIDDNY